MSKMEKRHVLTLTGEAFSPEDRMPLSEQKRAITRHTTRLARRAKEIEEVFLPAAVRTVENELKSVECKKRLIEGRVTPYDVLRNLQNSKDGLAIARRYVSDYDNELRRCKKGIERNTQMRRELDLQSKPKRTALRPTVVVDR